MQDIQQARAQVELAQQQAAEQKAIYEFYRENPQWALMANTNLLREFHHGEPITLQSLRESVAFLKDKLATKDDGRLEREASQNRINLLESLRELTGEIPAATKWQSTDEIRSTVEAIQRKREMQSKTPTELRQIIKDNTPVVAEDEDDLPAHMTRQYLLDLKGPQFREICSRWTVKKVTERLNQR